MKQRNSCPFRVMTYASPSDTKSLLHDSKGLSAAVTIRETIESYLKKGTELLNWPHRGNPQTLDEAKQNPGYSEWRDSVRSEIHEILRTHNDQTEKGESALRIDLGPEDTPKEFLKSALSFVWAYDLQKSLSQHRNYGTARSKHASTRNFNCTIYSPSRGLLGSVSVSRPINSPLDEGATAGMFHPKVDCFQLRKSGLFHVTTESTAVPSQSKSGQDRFVDVTDSEPPCSELAEEISFAN